MIQCSNCGKYYAENPHAPYCPKCGKWHCDPQPMYFMSNEEYSIIVDNYYASRDEYYQDVANELSITTDQAEMVVYLRSRSRWTQEMENELIISYTDERYIPVPWEAIITGEWRGGLIERV